MNVASGGALCPAGTVVISGGYQLLSGGISVEDSVVSNVTSAPNATNTGWSLVFFNNSQFTAVFRPFAICANAS
ncbi:hypothetical protein OHB01_33585 [Microbispora hainanensis]|uniref:Uncharacterized protein n=1 Tax=Microbispora hainanensis TaxID=568844 RepID=A0ABZ1T0U9_9ACTN|nr:MULTISPECIES: hypothetical protein [Microbispora]